MSHTNSTPNYSLPQFLTGDRPAWMADINAAMAAIDTGMKANADAATAAQSTADKAVLNGAPGYSNLSTYDVDDVVNYQGRVYKCIIAVTTPEAFDNAKWILYDLQDASKAIDDIDLEIGSGDISGIGDGSVKGAILEINNSLTNNTLGDSVALSSTPYVCLSDGYACVQVGYQIESYCYLYLNGVVIAGVSSNSTTVESGFNKAAVFVKKGMSIAIAGSGTFEGAFIPLE